jgi:CheY-like chemotaxis protein
MTMPELLPYFHPTQIVLVDDDIDFLGNLSLQLDADLAYLLFNSTQKALAYINDREVHMLPRQRFFNVLETACDNGTDSEPTRVGLNTEALVNEMYFTNRFSRISVAMVDYAMPQMNGLEFCERIRNPHIKKILFTGVATEADAVDAFNRGVIDRFIRKSEYQVYTHLNHTIRELQAAHIRDTFAAASEVFAVEKPPLLADPAVIELMEELKARYSAVEYYLASQPWGFLLVDADGGVSRLVLCDAAQRAAQLKAAQATGAPPNCLEALATGRVIMNPAVLDDNGQVADVFRQWTKHCRPAAALPGPHGYTWAVFKRRADEAARHPPIATYNRYLEWIDTLGYSLM